MLLRSRSESTFQFTALALNKPFSFFFSSWFWSECLGLPPGLRVPGTTPRARDSLPMPQEDTDDAVTPPTAVSDCLGARAAKNR